MKKYEQLPLDGSKGDYVKSIEKLDGLDEFQDSIKTFYEKNKKYNPRQLSYILKLELSDTEFNYLFDF